MEIQRIINECELGLVRQFNEVDAIALSNQRKVLQAFKNNYIAPRHFSGTSGYGYDDVGRATLSYLFADIFCAESALVSPYIASGTHALSLGFFSVLKRGDVLLSITGEPYDTLKGVFFGKDIGSLSDLGVDIIIDNLKDDGSIDLETLKKRLANSKIKMLFIQRSRGYNWRKALSIDEIECATRIVKSLSPETVVFVDNCYGEFVSGREPIEVGADLVAGSLIKNIGGGLAPNGGYVAGRKELIESVARRLTAPTLGAEVGSYMFGYQYFYQGLFVAPHVVAQAMKGAMLVCAVMQSIGYKTLPRAGEVFSDIICSIEFSSEGELVSFCQNIQANSPVDSFVIPEAWDMPGYEHKVIMAAGSFVQGASIELSCDSPIKKPYIAYLQGGLTYEHVKLALEGCLRALVKK